MSSNDDTSRRLAFSAADVTPNAFVDDSCDSVRGRLDCNDMVARLLATATIALDTDRRVTQRCVQRAAALLEVDTTAGRGRKAQRLCPHGGLASWQAKRLRSHIEEKLDSTIRAGELAGLVRLSKSHFFRAFRETFGESPLSYVMKRRMLRAQELMSRSRIPLSHVALECGMCDQAHFSRTFRRIVGTNPMSWRRQFLLSPARGEPPSDAA
jgi:AraC family transcriptional regulator